MYTYAKVYINEMYAGSSMNGYIPFLIDADPFLKEGRNEIRVICREYRDSRWYSGAGIYRNVSLLISDRTYIPHGKSRVTTKEADGQEAILDCRAESGILRKNRRNNTLVLLRRISLMGLSRYGRERGRSAGLF